MWLSLSGRQAACSSLCCSTAVHACHSHRMEWLTLSIHASPSCSKHAADKAVAAPSSTGLGLSAGGPAPSDARTGAAAGAEAADTAGTDQLWGGLGDGGGGEGRRRMPAVPALSTGPPKREDFERLLVRCQKKDIHSMFKEPVTEAIVSWGWFPCCWRGWLAAGLACGWQPSSPCLYHFTTPLSLPVRVSLVPARRPPATSRSSSSPWTSPP